jgi:hypothetical protein
MKWLIIICNGDVDISGVESLGSVIRELVYSRPSVPKENLPHILNSALIILSLTNANLLGMINCGVEVRNNIVFFVSRISIILH